MSEQEKELTEKESLELIASMINKAKNSYHSTGVGAIMWGALVAFCSLEKFCEAQFNYRLPFDIYVLTMIAVIPQIILSIKEKRARIVKTYDDIVLTYLWLSFGICMFLVIVYINSLFAQLVPVMDNYRMLAKGRTDWIDFRLSEFVSPLFLIIYGFPTFVTGAICKFKPMFWGGILCWTCSLITIFTPIKIDLLLTGLSALFAWFIPGLIMERQYRKAKRDLKQANV